MSKPIICLSSTLRQFLETFRPCFSRRQWRYFVTVLLGLVECEGRSTLTGFLRCIGEEISLSGLSRFLSRWSWSPAEIVAIWWCRFREQMSPLVEAEHAGQRARRPKRRGRPKATVVTGYLMFDDSVHTKPKGQKMGGLGRHYSGTENRVMTGHCLFTGLYVLLGRRCPLAPLITRRSLDQPLKWARYWGSTLVEADAQTVINILAARWAVEVFFEDYKDLLGSDQYQLMSATAIIRFWTLLSCLACFLDERRAYLQAQNPREHFTLGDVRQALQAEHQRNLLTWLEEQFQSGMTVSQLGARMTV